MSVLWLKSGYTVKYSLSPQEIPRAPPSGFPSCSGYISPYIPPLVIIQIQYSRQQQDNISKWLYYPQMGIFDSKLVIFYPRRNSTCPCKFQDSVNDFIKQPLAKRVGMLITQQWKTLLPTLTAWWYKHLHIVSSKKFLWISCSPHKTLPTDNYNAPEEVCGGRKLFHRPLKKLDGVGPVDNRPFTD